MIRAAALALAALLLAGGCGGSKEVTGHAPAAAGPFAYDASQPLRFTDRGRVNHDYPIAVHDVSFASGGARIEAYLATPPRTTRGPAAIFLHGAGGNRDELLVQAVWLAGRGATTLALTAPSTSAKPPRGADPATSLRWQAATASQDVVAVRRAVDLLGTRATVDPSRIGFLGWSAGARTGAILAGVEPRLRVLVLMSGGATPVSAYAARAPAGLRADVKRILGPVDPLRYIGRARPGSLLLQDGRRDEVVPQGALERLARRAPQGTEVRWYPAGHALDEAASRDQLDWLAESLALRRPFVRGARTGP